MDKLEQIDIKGVAYDLIKSSLYEWKQHIKANNVLRDFINVIYSVLKGTVLGPLLSSFTYKFDSYSNKEAIGSWYDNSIYRNRLELNTH